MVVSWRVLFQVRGFIAFSLIILLESCQTLTIITRLIVATTTKRTKVLKRTKIVSSLLNKFVVVNALNKDNEWNKNGNRNAISFLFAVEIFCWKNRNEIKNVKKNRKRKRKRAEWLRKIIVRQMVSRLSTRIAEIKTKCSDNRKLFNSNSNYFESYLFLNLKQIPKVN